MRAALLFFTAAVAVAVAGCGGGSLPHRAYVEKANAICNEQRGKVEAIPRPGALVQFEDYLGKVLPIVRSERDQIGKLKPPSPDKRSADALLAGWDDVLAALERMQRGARAGDDAQIALGLRTAFRANAGIQAPARALSLRHCANFSPFTR